MRQLQSDRRLQSCRTELSDHHFSGCELLATRKTLLARLPSRGAVAEVGVSEGVFSRQIVEIADPQTLYLIDLWQSSRAAFGQPAAEKVQQQFTSLESAGIVRIMRGYSWEQLLSLPESSLDWVYIDASHEYEHVARDLEAARRAVKADGYIAGHDYLLWSSPMLRFGVVEAVNEFCMRHDFVFRYLTMEPNGHHSYAIQSRAG
jgi:hypothetical protein